MANWKFDEVIVIDLEATCWSTPEETALNQSEIIELGVCILDTLTGEIRKRDDGKILKPDDWTPPNLEPFARLPE